jgi:hypothetical protein
MPFKCNRREEKKRRREDIEGDCRSMSIGERGSNRPQKREEIERRCQQRERKN